MKRRKTSMRQKEAKVMMFWLFLSAGMILFMILLGGWTRLTGSGLSMVDWKPITGIFPPLTPADWQAVFDLYQTSPEYQKINFGMSLEDFKRIFWLEFIHRLWGRLIGLVYLIPVFYAWRRPSLRPFFLKPLIGLWGLGALQGVVGWYMVKSGLSQDPHVSPYRLSLHLLMGCAAYGGTLWLAFKAIALMRAERAESQKLSPLFGGLVVLVSLTILYGGLVAGHKAGLLYNTFPLMGGAILPSDAWFEQPILINFWSNPVMVQFVHRVLALSTLLYVSYLWVSRRDITQTPKLLRCLHVLMGLAGGQVILGILTLLYQSPLVLASLHQLGALLLFSKSLMLLRYVSAERIRAATPGSSFPSSHSRKAPPALET